MTSRKNSIFTHLSKIQNYEVCIRIKITRTPCRRRTGNSVSQVEKFDNLITADFKVFTERFESRYNHQYSIVIQELTAQCIQSYPYRTKTSQEIEEIFYQNISSRLKSRKSFTLYKSLDGMWQILWRFIMKSSYFHISSIWDDWDCRKSSTQNKGKNVCSIVTDRKQMGLMKE